MVEPLEHLQHLPRHARRPLLRLIGIGVPADVDKLGLIARRRQFTFQQLAGLGFEE